MKFIKKYYKKIICTFLALGMLLIIGVFGINFYVKLSTKKLILNEKNISNIKDVDCILILGAGVWGSNPSPMLTDRLERGLELYNNKVAPKIIMSGDHGTKDYDEVNVMKEFATKREIPSEDVFMDHAGFSTYESMYRAKEIFKAKKIIIITQKYHLYRSLYIAKSLGLDAYGVYSDEIHYAGTAYREMREIIARDKDFIKCIYKPKPTYLGEAIPVSGDGNATNDK